MADTVPLSQRGMRAETPIPMPLAHGEEEPMSKRLCSWILTTSLLLTATLNALPSHALAPPRQLSLTLRPDGLVWIAAHDSERELVRVAIEGPGSVWSCVDVGNPPQMAGVHLSSGGGGGYPSSRLKVSRMSL
jgi:hypothetical protein